MSDWTKKVLIVDDDVLISSLMVEYLRAKGYSAQAATNVRLALEQIADFDPDLVFMDIHLGSNELSGLQLARRLSATNPDISIIFLSNYPVIESLNGNLPSGSQYVSKATIGEKIERLLEVIESAKVSDRAEQTSANRVSLLSKSQIEVLKMAAEGMSNKAIAEKRGTQTRTVEELFRKIYATLGVPASENLNPRVTAIRQYIDAAGLP